MKRNVYISRWLLPLILGVVACDDISSDNDNSPTPYITKVLDYLPAPGQYVNTMPSYEEGDTQAAMNEKVLERIGNNAQGMITLGGYGGYVVVGFDHTIENREGLCDFRVLANAYSGSSEAGIIMVSVDSNANGTADDQWYEIAGSAHADPSQESWYQTAVDSGNDVNFYLFDFSISYTAPTDEPSADGYSTYIPWVDNKGGSGYIAKNGYNTQCYFPAWSEQSALTFTGSRLPQNAIDESGTGASFVLQSFAYGYADNAANSDDASCIDISWAVDSTGSSVELAGVDFIKIYNGVNQQNGWIGESSTEVVGVSDLHLLGEVIESKY